METDFIQMDDPHMESEIQEYSSPDQGGKMNWMLDKGLMLGKKALLTGIMISSAPFLLPPLVVFSAFGLAFSVPSGLAIASYACTEKIMNKLLPMPNLPPMALANKEEFSTDDEEDKMVCGGEIATRKVEELMEDTRRGVDVRIEFIDECKEEWVEEKVMVQLDNLGAEYILNDEVAEPVTQLGGDHLVEESECEGDVKDSLPEKDEQPLGDITMEVEESRHAKARRLVMVFGNSDSNAKEMKDGHPENNVQRVVVKVEKTDESVRRGETWIQETTMAYITDEKELSAETTGLLERIRNENKSMKETGRHRKGITGGHRDQTGAHDNVEADELIDVGFETMEEKQRPVVCERTTFVIDASDCLAEDVPFDMSKENVISSNADVREIADESDIRNEEGETETTGLLGRIRHGNKSIEEAKQQEKGIPGGNRDHTGPDNDVEADKMIEVGFGADDFQGIVEEEQRPVVCDRTTLIIAGMDDNNHVAEDVPFDLGRENVISSNADKKQIANESDIANEAELEAETTGLLEGIRDDNKSMVVAEHQEKGIPGGNQDKTGFDDNVEPEKRMDIGFETLDICSIIEEGQRPVVCERTTLVIGEMDANNCVAEDVTFELRKENVTSLNADTRGIADESGFDLFQDQNAAHEQFSHGEVNVLTGSRDQKGKDFNLDFNVLSEKDNIAKSNEEEQVLESEEKLWERIMAMRAIVGYRAPASKTCAEELKSLYIFTGVEPPSSFKDPSDLMEVSSRLQFLMSIVGVK